MTDLLLKFIGAETKEAGKVSGFDVLLRGPVAAYWIVLLMLVAVAAAWWLYKREEGVGKVRRWTMTAFRAAFLLLLIGLLLRPVVRFTVEGEVRRALLFLVDNSGSMALPDPRLDEADRKRAAIAQGVLPPSAGLDAQLPDNPATPLTGVPRVKLVQAALRNDQLDLLPRLAADYDLRAFSFSQQTSELASPTALKLAGNPTPEQRATLAEWVGKLDGTGTVTATGDALRDVLSRTRGQPLAGIVLITDGATNAGSPVRSVAELAKLERVPVYAWGVGIANPKDVAVTNLFVPSVAFIDDEVNATVRFRAAGVEGETGTLVVKLGDKVVERKTIRFGPDGEQVVAVNVKPDKPGDYTLTATIEPLAAEVVKDNNEAAEPLRVIDGKIKVLLVEQQPRWEYKYLHALLSRDKRVQMKTVLLDAGGSIATGDDAPYLARFPTKKEELFQYDLMVLGDVDGRSFSAGQLDMIHEYVSKFGGGLLMVAGRKNAPQSYGSTPVEKMLPVEWDKAAAARAPKEEASEKPIRLELTPAGRANLMLRLADTETDSAAAWAKLPPIYWTAAVTRAKPAAEVLLVDPDPARATRFGKMPVVALQQYGLGQVMFVGTDNTWRWRRNVGDRYYGLLWGQMVQRLSLPHLLGEAKRTQLSADKKRYAVGERVTIFARLYTQSFEPITESVVRGVLTSPTGQKSNLQLRPLPDQPGMYRGELIAPTPGVYTFNVENDPATKLELPVTEPKLEMANTAMNEAALREVAEVSGGAFLREEDLHKLPSLLTTKTERVRSTFDVEVWSSPAYFTLLILLVGSEWVLRKMSQLK